MLMACPKRKSLRPRQQQYTRTSLMCNRKCKLGIAGTLSSVAMDQLCGASYTARQCLHDANSLRNLGRPYLVMQRTGKLAQLALVLGLLCSTATAWDIWGSSNPDEDKEVLPGWLGNTHKAQSEELWVEQISWRPRAYILHNLLSHAEADHIINASWVQMKRSTVVAQDGSDVLDDYRTSYGTFLNRAQDKVIEAVQQRVALYTHAPMIHQESMQVLRYGHGQYYKRHEDSLEIDTPRMATVLLYLTDTEEGGETSFPTGEGWANPGQAAKYGADLSECARGHVAYRPRKGDALMFWSINPDGTRDHTAEHEGCPVVKGAKWSGTIWVHTAPYRPQEYDPATQTYNADPPGPDPGLCLDKHAACPAWAQEGECDRNTAFMKKSCTRSCGVCRACHEHDVECYNQNRRQAGYLVFNPSELEYRHPDRHTDL